MRLNDGNHSMACSQIPYAAEQEFQIAILFQSAFGSGRPKISAADEVFEKEGKGRQRQAACRNITRPQAMAEQVADMIAVGCRRNACFELPAEWYVDRAGENAAHENARADKKNPTESLENGNPSGSSPC